jgi:acetyltransferase-like isoleucine patch superfamily enzyme
VVKDSVNLYNTLRPHLSLNMRTLEQVHKIKKSVNLFQDDSIILNNNLYLRKNKFMALIKPVRGFTPSFGENCFIAENATIVGEVTMGNDCSIWFNTAL